MREQWFVRMAPLAEPALAAVADGRIRILPERFEKARRHRAGREWAGREVQLLLALLGGAHGLAGCCCLLIAHLTLVV